MTQYRNVSQYRDIVDAFDSIGYLDANGNNVIMANGTSVADGALCGPVCCPPSNQASCRIIYAGFDRVCIPACGTAVSTLTIAARSTPIALYIPEASAEGQIIISWNLGMQTMLGNCNGISASLFTCCDVDENVFGGITLEANTEICLELENTTKRNVDFAGATLKALATVQCG